MPHDDVRSQLTAAMERRRVELGVTWRQIAAKSGLSIEVLRSVRKENREITPRTRRALEVGLEWPQGTVTAILEGKPLPSTDDEPAGLDEVERQLWAIKGLATSVRWSYIELYRDHKRDGKDAG